MTFPGTILPDALLVNPGANFLRIEWIDADEVALAEAEGTQIVINRVVFYVDDFGSLSNTSNLMAADGTDTGVPLPSNEVLYVYACGNLTSFGTTLAASQVPPTRVGGDWYLGIDPLFQGVWCRFVGLVYLVGGNFVDTAEQRLVWNQWNRIPKTLYSNFGYVGDDADTTYVVTAATFRGLNNGTGDNVQFLVSDGMPDGPHTGDLVQITATFAFGAASPAVCQVGFAYDGQATCTRGAQVPAAAPANTTVVVSDDLEMEPGFALATIYQVIATAGVAATLVADWAQSTGGADADIPATRLSGTCWC